MEITDKDSASAKLSFKIESDAKLEAKLRLNYKFFDLSDQKIVNRNIRYLIGVANATRDREVQQRRERLKYLLEEEELKLEGEILCQGYNQKMCIAQRKQESLEAQRQQQKIEEKKFLNMKKIQQYLSNCDEIRTQLQKQNLIESKKCQKAQIELNAQRRAADLENERLWNEVLQKMQEAKNKKEDYERQLRQNKKSENKVELEKQILAAQRAREEERRILCHEGMEHEFGKSDNKAEMARNRQKLIEASLRKSQLDEAIVLRRKAQERENEKDAFNQELFNAQIEQEKKEMQIKMENLRQSTLQYLRYCRELKMERTNQAKEEEKRLEEFQMQTNAKSQRVLKEAKERRAREAQKAHQELLAQICEKEVLRVKCAEEKKRLVMIDLQRYDNDMLLENEKQRKREMQAQQYAKDLRLQIESIKRAEEEQKRQFAMDLKKAGEEEDYCHTLAKKFIEDKISYLPTHPNWKLLSCPCLD